MAVEEHHIKGSIGGTVDENWGTTTEQTVNIPDGEEWYIEEFRALGTNRSSSADGENDIHIRAELRENIGGVPYYRRWRNDIAQGNAGSGDTRPTTGIGEKHQNRTIDIIVHGSGVSVSVDDIEWELVVRRVV